MIVRVRACVYVCKEIFNIILSIIFFNNLTVTFLYLELRTQIKSFSIITIILYY